MDAIAPATIVVYLVAATAVGSLMARRAGSSAGWAVAGGGMSTAMVAFGVAGTRIGGAGTYGVAGDVITGGVWNLWWYGINTFLALAIVGIFFGVYYRRFRLHTVGELFTIRFGTRRCQWLTSLCVQTEYVVVNLIEAYVIGVILSTLTPLSMFGGVMVAAVIFSTYVSLGGLWGTAVTNLIHCSVVLVGLLWVGLAGIEQLGGWPTVTAAVGDQLAAASRSETAWWGFAGAGWLPVIGMFFAASVHTPAASVYTNYSTAARTERQIAPAFLIGGLIAAAMSVLAGLIGVLTTARYGFDAGLGGYRNLTTLASEIDPVVGGVALAAVLAAVISSGGPILLSSATMVVDDWLPAARRRTFRSSGSRRTASPPPSTPSRRRSRPGTSPPAPRSPSSTCCCSGSRWWCRRPSPSATSSTGGGPPSRARGGAWRSATGPGSSGSRRSRSPSRPGSPPPSRRGPSCDFSSRRSPSAAKASTRRTSPSSCPSRSSPSCR